MTSKISLKGIKTIGYHGANPGEQDKIQTFFVDVEMLVEVADDSIKNTADYCEVIAVVKKIVEQKQYQLIETLAFSIAKKLSTHDRITYIKVKVHKPEAAKSLLINEVSAEVEIGKR